MSAAVRCVLRIIDSSGDNYYHTLPTPTAVPSSYVLENDALLVNAEKRNCALKENFYLAASCLVPLLSVICQGLSQVRAIR